VIDSDELYRAIGDELQLARKQAELLQQDLADRLSIPRNTLATYEQGIRGCSIPRMVELCQEMGISAPKLLDRALRRVTAPRCPTCQHELSEGVL
jgi:transcriptional regulator with XRE-family HTH domain